MTISAKIIADSIDPNGHRITTFELEYPRFIHAEFMTHRVFSRNAASSRAIPVSKAIELIRENTAMPIHWGKNQPGMSAKEECNNPITLPSGNISALDSYYTREDWWYEARDDAILRAEFYNQAGYHKQIVNRLLEPFTHIKVVMTTTELDNFFWLRRHPDAQPEIQELAEKMWQACNSSFVAVLMPGDWHLPYYGQGFWKASGYVDITQDDITDLDGKRGHSLQDAIAISASCCAQVSYRKNDDSLEKAKAVYKRLVESTPVHASPFEHQATPMPLFDERNHLVWPQGVTHMDRNGSAWSGNFRGWIQNRQLIPNNTCFSYEG